MTKQRRVILEALRMTDSHPTVDEIYEMVRRRLPRISLGTVYRNLEMLSMQGLIQKIGIGASQRRFDGQSGVHYHVRCMRCGRVDDAPMEKAPEIDDSVIGGTDYEITGHRLEFVGLCPACRTESGARKRY